MEVEIELKSAALSGDIYELKNYLEENIEGLRLEIRTQPAPEGQMLIEAIGIGILHGVLEVTAKQATKLLVERGKKIIQLIKEWNSNKEKMSAETQPQPQSLGPGISLQDGDQKLYITEDDKGNIQAFDNLNFAIDTGQTYALLIGVSEFEGDFPPIPPIRNNLIDFYNLLVDKCHIGLPRKNIQVVFNKTDHEIQEMMLRVSRTPGMETLILYYSGHGHKSDIKSLTLTARNTKKIGDVILGGIDLNFITDKVLRPSTASQKILILDACHSGIAAQGNDDIVRMVNVKGTYTLTSSGDEASYFDKQAQNTYFTGTMLELLRKGTEDVTREMISLEDIYKLSSEKLVSERFPKPNSKNELNIPATDFFLAHNPSFSLEKLKQKTTRLMKQGKLREAMHEYIILSQRYPEDMQLKKEADECRDHLAFTQLVDEGDQLYFNVKDYRKAFEKYKRALTLKDDVTVAARLSKCEEFLNQGWEFAKEAVIVSDKKNMEPLREKKKELISPQEHDEKLKGQAINKGSSVVVEPASFPVLGKKIWVIITSAWLLISIIFLWLKLSLSDGSGDFPAKDQISGFFNTTCLPFLLIAVLLIGIRNKRVSTTEILLYITGAIPASFFYTAKLSDVDNNVTLAVIFLLAQSIIYLFWFRWALLKFSGADLVIACIPLLYFIMIPFIALILFLFKEAWTDDVAGPVGIAMGVIATALTIFYSYRYWKRSRH